MTLPSMELDTLSQMAVVNSTEKVSSSRYQELESHRTYLKQLAKYLLDGKLRDHMSASDIVQDTLVSAFKRVGSEEADGIGNLKNWLRGILQKKIVEYRRYYRSKKRNPPGIVPIDSVAAGGIQPMSDHPVTSRVDIDDIFAWAMSELPNDQRVVIELYLMHHLSWPEIADSLGLSIDCVRKRYERGIEFLKTRIDP